MQAYASINDANINRFKEGARVLEDIARFVLKDMPLFTEIKALKHRVQAQIPFYTLEPDIGGSDYVETHVRENMISLAMANGCRMQEAARVLEETYARQLFKEIRFESYRLHSKLMIKLLQFLKLPQLSGIYAICDPQKYSLAKMAKYINNSMISICQIRMKTAMKREVLAAVQQMRDLLNPDKILIVNDHFDIALLYAQGVHLGQDDLPVALARKIAPSDFIIGVSCHDTHEAQQAIAAGATYIAAGCLFPTQTKQSAIPMSLAMLRDIVALATVPVCAIGGINPNNMAKVWETQVAMVAMQTALWETG